MAIFTSQEKNKLKERLKNFIQSSKSLKESRVNNKQRTCKLSYDTVVLLYVRVGRKKVCSNSKKLNYKLCPNNKLRKQILKLGRDRQERRISPQPPCLTRTLRLLYHIVFHKLWVFYPSCAP